MSDTRKKRPTPAPPKPIPVEPEITPGIEQRYVIEGGGFCPACQRPDKFRRLAASNEFFLDDRQRPSVKLFASCGGCGMDWWEIYSLIGLEAS